MAPQKTSMTATANTTNLLLSAKSTSARIMTGFLSHQHSDYLLSKHVVEHQGICHHLLSRREPRLDLLQIRVVLQEVSTDDFHAAESVAWRGYEDEVAILHVQDGGRR